MAKSSQFLQILPVLSFTLVLILSSRLALASPHAINNPPNGGEYGGASEARDGDSVNDNTGFNDIQNVGHVSNNNNNNNNEDSTTDDLLSDLRVSTHITMIRFCQLCSFIIEDMRRPVVSIDEGAREIADVVYESLVCIHTFLFHPLISIYLTDGGFLFLSFFLSFFLFFELDKDASPCLIYSHYNTERPLISLISFQQLEISQSEYNGEKIPEDRHPVCI